MRVHIYNRVKNIASLPAAFKEDVVSSGAADNPEAPFLIVSMGVERSPFGLPSYVGAQEVPFTIWVHDKPGSMVAIDDAAVALKVGLPTRDGFMLGGLSVYEIKWVETGDDSYDDHFGTNCRPVRFLAMTRR